MQQQYYFEIQVRFQNFRVLKRIVNVTCTFIKCTVSHFLQTRIIE